EREPLAPHEPGANILAAGQVLDGCLGKPAILVRLAGEHEPGAAELGNIVRDTVIAPRQEGRARRADRVLAEKLAASLEQNTLTVFAATPHQDDSPLAGRARGAIAEGAAEEGPEGGLRLDALEEGLPQRADGRRIVVNVD